MVFEWTPEVDSLLQDQPFSAAASVYISREATDGRLRYFPALLYWVYLRNSGQETLYETCACVIHTNLQRCIIIPLYETFHDLPFSVTSEGSLRDSVPEHQGTGYFMRSECIKLVLVSFTLIYS